jgi:hypothetical protein
MGLFNKRVKGLRAAVIQLLLSFVLLLGKGGLLHFVTRVALATIYLFGGGRLTLLQLQVCFSLIFGLV